VPEGRLPDAYIILNQLPLTSTGSIDWEALPIPDFHLGEREYCAPRSQLEQQLCDVWQEVLGIPQIGIFDDFFRLGGDSILSMQVSAKLRQLGIDCSVKSIFEHRCIESLLVDIHPLVANGIEVQQSESQDNFVYADISPELMEFLQQSYE
jgi:aryl carrier-like protein